MTLRLSVALLKATANWTVHSRSLAKVPTSLKGKTKSSQEWLTRQFKDPYVQKAREMNYRARSAFKLLEINDKFHFLHPGQTVLDCGAAPGSWSQVLVELINSNGARDKVPVGKVVAVDKSVMRAIDGVVLLDQADFTSMETAAKLTKVLNGEKLDVILSDMAPNASGDKQTDHFRLIQLCVAVMGFASKQLKPGGSLLMKMWDGPERLRITQLVEANFKQVKTVKPASSRDDSAEMFLFATGFRQN